jgi:hypothetical protein
VGVAARKTWERCAGPATEWDPNICEDGLKREFRVPGAVLAIYWAALFVNAVKYRDKTEEKKEEPSPPPPSPACA